MPKIEFNFGANRKPRRSKAKVGRAKKTAKGRGSKSNAWRAYVGGSTAPIPD